MTGLTDKQARFVEEYLVDLNATQAAIRAGYAASGASVEGVRLLGNAKIADAVAALMAERSERVAITVDYVLRNLAEVTERCMQRAPVMVGQGKDRCQAKDEDGRDVWEFNANGANKSLELLGKHLGMFKDKVELSGAIGMPEITLGRADD